MGVGYPDYFGQSIFLTYGITKKINESSGNILDSGFKEICKIETKGKLLTGWLTIGWVAAKLGISILIMVDGIESVIFTTNYSIAFGLWNTKNYSIKPIYDNEETKILTFDLQGDITFSNSIALLILNGTGGIITAMGELVYTEVIQ